MVAKFFGKLALITGAAQGVGKETVKLFAKNQANVCMDDINYKELKKAEIEINQGDSKVISIKTDISYYDYIKKMACPAIKEFGNIDFLINSATKNIVKPVMDLEWNEWDNPLNVNLKGTFFYLVSVAHGMIKNNISRSIVNITSFAGKGGRPMFLSYAAIKAAVIKYKSVCVFGIHTTISRNLGI